MLISCHKTRPIPFPAAGWEKVSATPAQLLIAGSRAILVTFVLCLFIPPWLLLDLGIFRGQPPDFNTSLALLFFSGFWYLAFRMYRTTIFIARTVIFWNDTQIIKKSAALRGSAPYSWIDLVELTPPLIVEQRLAGDRRGPHRKTLIFRDGRRISYLSNMRGGDALEKKIAYHLPDTGLSPA